jgi:hypothetical protein
MREAFGSPLDPRPQGAHPGGGPSLEDDVGGLGKEGAEVLVAALRDLAELGAIAGRLLVRGRWPRRRLWSSDIDKDSEPSAEFRLSGRIKRLRGTIMYTLVRDTTNRSEVLPQ